MNTVHSVGMSPNNSTYLTVDAFYGPDNEKIEIEPPVQVIFEGEDAATIAVTQDGLAARYRDEELCQIGEGGSAAGLNRVIGEIATNGNLKDGDFKPLISQEELERVDANIRYFVEHSLFI
jgi:hypothetical protein